jgi:hypothetical protein
MSPSLSQNYSLKAAAMLDENVARATDTLDRLGRQLTAGEEGTTSANPFGPVVAQQLGRVSQKLNSVEGEKAVEKAKDQITRHPAALTIAGALTGAALVQLAIMAVRSEQRAAASGARIENDQAASMMPDAS